MKPEHLDEATKLAKAVAVTKEQHHQLSIAEKLDVHFFNRQVQITKDDSKFETVRQAMLTFLDLRLAAQYRRANQIGLHIQPVVLEEPVPVKQASNAPRPEWHKSFQGEVSRDVSVAALADMKQISIEEANALFDKR